VPFPLQTFVRYGTTFQERFVPQLEAKSVERIERAPGGFAVRFDDGNVMRATHVVVAVGLTYFSRLPTCLATLPSSAVSHSSDHSDLSRFRGLRVAVVGGGASATEIAALLYDYGADVTLIARAPELLWLHQALPRLWWERLQNPHTDLGFGWRHAAYRTAPGLFRHLPSKIRQGIAQSALGPSGAWHVRNRVVGHVRLLLGQTLRSATVQGGRLDLVLVGSDGAERMDTADHIIAATGFEVDVARMNLLSEDLRARLQLIGTAPKLSTNFESSVPGLYFSGAAAAFTFGPLMRFVAGSGFAASRIARHLKNASAHRVNRASIGGATKSEHPRIHFNVS
jgi:cation diffusion facilitator CzcD-associated flavoprotein CzcO